MATQEDNELRSLLITWLRVPIAATLPDTHVRLVFHPVIAALRANGINTIALFLSLSDEQLSALMGPANLAAQTANNMTPLLLAFKVQLRQCIAFYHHQSRIDGQPCDTLNNRDVFEDYILNNYSGTTKITPWSIPLPPSQMTAQQAELERFIKQIKLNKHDFIEFKVPEAWQTTKESWLTTAKAQGLGHILNTKFVPTNLELDEHQNYFVYAIMKDKMKEPTARTIVTSFVETRNARDCWGSISDHFDTDITAEIKSQNLSTFLTADRSLTNRTWTGTDREYILKW